MTSRSSGLFLKLYFRFPNERLISKERRVCISYVCNGHYTASVSRRVVFTFDVGMCLYCVRVFMVEKIYQEYYALGEMSIRSYK